MPSVLNTFKPCKHEISFGSLFTLISSRAAHEIEIFDKNSNFLSSSHGLNSEFNVMRIMKITKKRKLMWRDEILLIFHFMLLFFTWHSLLGSFQARYFRKCHCKRLHRRSPTPSTWKSLHKLSAWLLNIFFKYCRSALGQLPTNTESSWSWHSSNSFSSKRYLISCWNSARNG